MPKRKISIPSPIQLVDPFTKAKADELLTFPSFLDRVFQNPLWNESFKAALAQQAISAATEQALAAEKPEVEIAEGDWDLLCRAINEPKAQVPGGVVAGFGLLPQFARQLVPMQQAIIEAVRVP